MSQPFQLTNSKISFLQSLQSRLCPARARTKASFLCQPLYDRLQQVLQQIQSTDKKDFQSYITLRMRELALSKILTFTYQQPQFILIRAEVHMGTAYLKFRCYEQAQTHFESASLKNSLLPHDPAYQAYILHSIAECLLQTNRTNQALDQLNAALLLSQGNARILLLLARTHARMNHEHEAMASIESALGNYAHSQEYKHSQEQAFEHSLILYEKFLILVQFNHQGMEVARKAVQVMQLSNHSEWEEYVIRFYEKMGAVAEENSDEQLQLLRDKYNVMEGCFGNSDKRCIREERNVATVLLRRKEFQECLDLMEDILEKEQKIYGENSVEVGRSLKSISAVMIAMGNQKGAEGILKKSMKIFQDHGELKVVKEIKTRINSIKG